MNEVADAFWNQENSFWLVSEVEPDNQSEYTFAVTPPKIAFCRTTHMPCSCEDADLMVEDSITVRLTIDRLKDLLAEHKTVQIWDLETTGTSYMTRKDD